MSAAVSANQTLPKPWSPDELAEAVGLDRKTVYSSIARGEIPVVRIGRRFLIPAAWIAARFGADGCGGEKESTAKQHAEAE